MQFLIKQYCWNVKRLQYPSMHYNLINLLNKEYVVLTERGILHLVNQQIQTDKK